MNDIAVLVIMKLNMLFSVTTRYFMEEFDKQYPSRSQKAWVWIPNSAGYELYDLKHST